MKFIFLVFFFSIHSFAAVDIAYIEMHTPNGKLIQLEPNGRYAHVAIAFQGLWLHADPKRGGELVNKETLEQMGKLTIVHYPSLQQPSEAEVRDRIGRPYDPTFSWYEIGTDYCVKQIAQLLHVQPRPMTFAAPIWPEVFRERAGELGLSPDDLYEILKPLAQPSAPACARSI